MARILVIDDDPKVLNKITEQLQTEGHEVSGTDGISALDIIREKFDFDLVLSDVVMPEVDGYKIVDEVRKVNKVVPIFLMTGFGTIEDAVNSIKSGATNYLTKPFKLKELGIELNKALEICKFKTNPLNLKGGETEDKIFCGLSSSVRRNIILGLKESPMSFGDLVEYCHIENPTKLNFHLAKLKEGRLIDQKEKRKYCLTPLGEKIFHMFEPLLLK